MFTYCRLFIVGLFLSGYFSSCIAVRIHHKKGIVYDQQSEQKLDVYFPKDSSKHSIMVFVHGGNWRSGNRKMYAYLGKRLALKGVVSVIVDYRLSDQQAYEGMAMDVARSVKWISEHAVEFQADNSKLYLSGHSAGGHLCSLVALDNRYLDSIGQMNTVKGVFLIDAFGLDMDHYLRTATGNYKKIYEPVFSKDTLAWRKASPVYYVTKSSPPFFQLVGGKTFPAIKEDNARFLTALEKYRSSKIVTVPNKGHFEMIGMFLKRKSKYYETMLDFMNATGQK